MTEDTCSQPILLFLHGKPAAGKLTVAKEFHSLSGDRFRLFHNHLVVDALLALFDFGTPQFVSHRERIWLSTMPDAIADKKSLIFTFAPENTVTPEFVPELQRRVIAAGGRIVFVELVCEESDIEARMESMARKQFQKLSDVQLYRTLRDEGVAFAFPALPVDLQLNTSILSPLDAAKRIADALQLL